MEPHGKCERLNYLHYHRHVCASDGRLACGIWRQRAVDIETCICAIRARADRGINAKAEHSQSGAHDHRLRGDACAHGHRCRRPRRLQPAHPRHVRERAGPFQFGAHRRQADRADIRGRTGYPAAIPRRPFRLAGDRWRNDCARVQPSRRASEVARQGGRHALYRLARHLRRERPTGQFLPAMADPRRQCRP